MSTEEGREGDYNCHCSKNDGKLVKKRPREELSLLAILSFQAVGKVAVAGGRESV